jgi:hypothetical protein
LTGRESGRVLQRRTSAWNRWHKAAVHDAGLKARPWLAPQFGAHGADAIQTFRETFIKLIDAAVSAMPKR